VRARCGREINGRPWCAVTNAAHPPYRVSQEGTYAFRYRATWTRDRQPGLGSLGSLRAWRCFTDRGPLPLHRLRAGRLNNMKARTAGRLPPSPPAASSSTWGYGPGCLTCRLASPGRRLAAATGRRRRSLALSHSHTPALPHSSCARRLGRLGGRQIRPQRGRAADRPGFDQLRGAREPNGLRATSRIHGQSRRARSPSRTLSWREPPCPASRLPPVRLEACLLGDRRSQTLPGALAGWSLSRTS